MKTKTWTGWIWRDGDWNEVCQHADMGEAHRLLIRYADQHGVEMKYTGITGGGKPEWKLE